ncbi:uncharacterized protein LOC111084588 [Limulus polyphemus]|uniref:Uncharacterized protein LOC111084588 n=1 Tax=Limulus polyphemus TaxID=6850 RepID=A0ABM1S009_LIMPO|nr:uncharacterized protein LOC111084588 [Limulus polyphemus]
MKIHEHELFLFFSLSLNSKRSRNLSWKVEKVKIEHERIFFRKVAKKGLESASPPLYINNLFRLVHISSFELTSHVLNLDGLKTRALGWIYGTPKEMVIVLCRSRKFKWHKKAFRLRLPFHQNKGLILVCPLLILRRNVLTSHLCPLPNLSFLWTRGFSVT